MGLLTLGTPLAWEDSLKHLEHVKRHGVAQFIATYERIKDRHNDVLLWGEEVEYTLINLDPDRKVARLSLRAPEILAKLNAVKVESSSPCARLVQWHPEYSNWQLEATPGEPYGSLTTDLADVEGNMKLRRACVQAFLLPNEYLFSITSAPRMGAGEFTLPPTTPNGPVQRSLYMSDAVINPHPRFRTLSANIRKRRGEKVKIHVPLFLDYNTVPSRLRDKQSNSGVNSPSSGQRHLEPNETLTGTAMIANNNVTSSNNPSTTPLSSSLTSSTFISKLHRIESGVTLSVSPSASACDLNGSAETWSINDALSSNQNGTSSPVPIYVPIIEPPPEQEIYMDSMAFGMGCCCLQATFQARDINEARLLYDQLAPLTPIMLALTAATPIFKGLLADTDVRWNTIVQSVDDRTRAERGLEAKSSKRTIRKSRYDSIDCYISNGPLYRPEYNDVDLQYDETSYKELRSAGIDDLLAKHVAHLFIRDPLVVYEETLHQDDSKDTDHFENLQSTNWNTVRFKPPPAGSSIGWRVEFRSMEVQLTDFENAAFVVFVVLISRIILYFGLDFYIPISKVDENMAKAHVRGAVTGERFYFRKYISKATCALTTGLCSSDDDDNGFLLMTIDEIFNGKGDEFPGLVPLVGRYLDSISCDIETRTVVDQYLSFISKRASGDLVTLAQYIRHYVDNHPSYRHDSVISDEVAYDLLTHLNMVATGEVQAPELLGNFILPDSFVSPSSCNCDGVLPIANGGLKRQPRVHLSPCGKFLIDDEAPKRRGVLLKGSADRTK
mmetsp:Transcript_7946/g.12744  ORF Transcript_7946/g.12744 Transcript_7946/m.12744 type:complete len:782 (-) Transcript_7946:725-3070(-)